LPKGIFIRNYPSNPKGFGERLKKPRMDAGLRVKELAEIIWVTPDTVINWEIRGMKPKKEDIQKKLETILVGLNDM
jgi:transcriptional regulator with XRE-family HTH domain